MNWHIFIFAWTLWWRPYFFHTHHQTKLDETKNLWWFCFINRFFEENKRKRSFIQFQSWIGLIQFLFCTFWRVKKLTFNFLQRVFQFCTTEKDSTSWWRVACAVKSWIVSAYDGDGRSVCVCVSVSVYTSIFAHVYRIICIFPL